MIDHKLLNDVFPQYFLEQMYEGIKKNEYTNNILQRMIKDGMTEEEACDMMIYCWLMR